MNCFFLLAPKLPVAGYYLIVKVSGKFRHYGITRYLSIYYGFVILNSRS